ncbi:hypothetical protein PV10_01938 [Exophiala mesophila]|uniref:Aminotransferase class I/classII large domain-containing protein n=1 Tax=Exophiala mesophila TaxID=212818 RepID=A0A0D1YC44_EXOME|nr:uncharacterized protein PV10_01938 [Exophiala mesophila]KIV98271.1 hypothetical protein PV10_01938 [Exophiala mesophila]
MSQLATFELPKWVEGKGPSATYTLAGSATPGLSINDLVEISNDKTSTLKALDFHHVKLGLGPMQGSTALRRAIAALYTHRKSWITEDHILTAAGTTGANLMVFQSLLKAGDHVVCTYPTYEQLSKYPLAQQCEVSLLRLRPQNGWKVDVKELKGLITPNTKMIVINSPSNPAGSHVDEKTQVQILEAAKEQGIIVLVDEIFRPLFHGVKPAPSFVEHDYDRVVVTGSMSKAWGLSGIRVGWITTRNQSFLRLLANAKSYIVQATGSIDEAIAAEALSDRCRGAILGKHLEYARDNLASIQAFLDRNSDMCSWTKPTAGAIGFIRLTQPSGSPLDDVEFCQSLLETKGVLFSPGSLTFGEAGDVTMKGYVRCHFTGRPQHVVEALALVDEYLSELRSRS